MFSLYGYSGTEKTIFMWKTLALARAGKLYESQVLMALHLLHQRKTLHLILHIILKIMVLTINYSISNNDQENKLSKLF